MTFSTLHVVCDQCGKTHTETVRYWDPKEYTGSILKSFWCQNCKAPQVIRYQFINGTPTVTEHLEKSSVLAPREPDTGITIRPRQGIRH